MRRLDAGGRLSWLRSFSGMECECYGRLTGRCTGPAWPGSEEDTTRVERQQMRYGIDTGGTFTDAVSSDGESIAVLKVPSTPVDPASAVLEALRASGLTLPPSGSSSIEHGTTVATNALLEGKGGRSVLVLSEGFRDLLEIGRQNRLEIYDLLPRKAAFPLDSELVLTARERTLPTGGVERSISRSDQRRLARRVASVGAKSVAVCFLHSYANPANEIELGEALRKSGLSVSLSHQVVGEFREFERCSTTFVNAYLAPVMEEYLGSLMVELQGLPFGIMQSSGGTASVSRIAQLPVRTLLSGPAAGVVGAARVSEDAGWTKALTLDMGGTSADVSIVDGSLARVPSLYVGGFPIVTPSVLIETVGAGGGSIAYLDSGGALKVGPESAGAEPGPACYGRSEHATVTDAHLVLGRIPEDGLLSGGFALYPKRAAKAVGDLARRMGCCLEEAAEGIVRVANATMEAAIRSVSVRRGYDPGDFVLVAFGGAGGLHACELAESLGVPAVMIPPAPGVLSAYGLLCAEAIEERSRTLFLDPEERDDIERELESLELEVKKLVAGGAVRSGKVRVERLADMRYVGQSFEISVPVGPDLKRRFHSAHRRLYGHAVQEAAVEVVNLRVRGIRSGPAPPPMEVAEETVPAGRRGGEIWWRGRTYRAAMHARGSLRSGRAIAGPSVVSEYSATTFIPPGWGGRVDPSRNLVLRPEGRGTRGPRA